MNLKELSSRLGLSPTTVSRALGGYPEVNAETRARVAAAAARYNYRPNKRAQALATGRSFNIGHVLSTKNKEQLVNPIFGDFIGGLTETSAAAGYSLSLTLTESDQEAATFRKLKSEGSVDGIVLQAPVTNDDRIALMHDIGMPFVVHGRASGIAAPYAWVDVNNRHAFHRAAMFLIDLGHRRIGLINGDERMDFAARRRSGYESALTDAGLPIDPTLTSQGAMTEDNGHAAAARLLAMDGGPSAIVVSSITLAIGARRAIQEAGLVMGQDVSLIAYDDDLSYLSNRQDVPVFTAVRSSVRAAGQKIAEVLIRQINDPDRGLEQELMEAELVVGTSTGPAA
ncbi:MAG: substrate-binding domain-containing protein [Pseudomonadota bacterium]